LVDQLNHRGFETNKLVFIGQRFKLERPTSGEIEKLIYNQVLRECSANSKVYEPTRSDGRNGSLNYDNFKESNEYVKIFHPSIADKVYDCFIFSDLYKNQVGTYERSKGFYPVGDNWGIQIGNSKIRLIKDVTIWDPDQRSFLLKSNAFER